MKFKIKKEYFINQQYKKRFCFGLKIVLDFNKRNVRYFLCGINFLTRTFWGGYSVFELFKFIKFETSRKSTANFLYQILIKYLENESGNQNFDIIPLYNRIGETYLLLHHIREFIKNNDIKNPVFISCYGHLKQITKMFCLDVPFILVPDIFVEIYFSPKSFEKYFQILPHQHFMQLEKKLQKGDKINFYTAIKNKMGVLNKEISYPVCNNEDIQNAKIKMSLLNLKKPYVFIAPDAQSNGTMSKEFFDKLPLELTKLGYDVFFNSIPWEVQNSFYKHCFLTLGEAKYVAQNAEAIIGVRSGLMDLIANKNSKIFCVYHAFFERGWEFPPLSADKVLNGFSLEYLPGVDKTRLHEYNGQITDEKEIMADIIKNLKGKTKQ